MPGLSAFEAIRQIRKAHPAVRVLMLSMYDDRDYVQEALDAGANGYVLKVTPASELLDARREVARGGPYMADPLLSNLLEDMRTPGALRKSSGSVLTSRERQILKLELSGSPGSHHRGRLDPVARRQKF